MHKLKWQCCSVGYIFMFTLSNGYVASDVSCAWRCLVGVQLTDEERVFLNAAALGDVPIVRQSLDDGALTLNVNCVDYMDYMTTSIIKLVKQLQRIYRHSDTAEERCKLCRLHGPQCAAHCCRQRLHGTRRTSHGEDQLRVCRGSTASRHQQGSHEAGQSHHRTSELHRRSGTVQAHTEGPVLSHRREESVFSVRIIPRFAAPRYQHSNYQEPVFSWHYAYDPGCALQQSRDHSDVHQYQSYDRQAAGQPEALFS